VAGQLNNMVLADPRREGRVAPIAVIDIGSNSIRLVIYASGGRYPFPLFNERSNCRLGGIVAFREAHEIDGCCRHSCRCHGGGKAGP
jgi:hypothetical protein